MGHSHFTKGRPGNASNRLRTEEGATRLQGGRWAAGREYNKGTGDTDHEVRLSFSIILPAVPGAGRPERFFTKLAPRGAWLRQKSCQEISCTVRLLKAKSLGFL
jgi:hypothetical protein